MISDQFSKNFQPGVAYGFPDAKGFGGTTTTAEVARKILSEEALRKRLVNLCPVIYRAAMASILLNDLTLLRLMSCSYLLLPEKIGTTKLYRIVKMFLKQPEFGLIGG